MRHSLMGEVLEGRVAAGTLADAMAARESWIPPLTASGSRLFNQLERAVIAGDDAVMLRARRSPMAVATLFALLPAPEVLRLFGPLESQDERLLGDAVSAFDASSRLGAMCHARMGFMSAVAALARLSTRVRSSSKRQQTGLPTLGATG